MKRFLLSILCCLMAVVSGYAKEYSYTFTSKQYSANGAKTLGGVEWTLAGDGGYWGYDGTKGQQFGSKNATYESMTFSTSGLAGKITKIVINTSGASDVKASFTVSVGGTQYGNSATLTATAKDYTFTGTSSGNIEFAYTQTSSKALYIKSITITYETDEGGSSEEPETPVAPTAPTLTAPCSFVNSMDVEITNIPKGATVYYTTDGTDPSTSNTEYSAPFEITATTTVKAIAVNEAGSSDVVSATYTKKEIIEGQVEDIITIDLIGETGNSYTSWTDKKSNSTAVYAGQSISNPDNIQLRSDKDKNTGNYSGIVTTTSGGKVKKVIVEWNPATAEARELNVYCSNNPYSTPNDLYADATNGELIGSIKKSGATELSIDGDYQYVGLRSKSSAMYINSITIIWETEEPTDDVWGSLYSPYDVEIPENVKVYIVTGENNGYVRLANITGAVPAMTGVIYNGEWNNKETATSDVADVTGNLLKGSVVDEYVTEDAFVLAKVDGVVGFYKAEMNQYEGTAFKNNGGKAYLPASALTASAQGASGFKFRFDNQTTGIESAPTLNTAKAIYDLSGRKVNNATAPGLYIVNGKKVMVK